ncbi:hypothetical protein PILCRDRAFT_445107 [Piloderma croceum F 1598]|uniref:Uncharacterized protein n=1 Tax=Piloderma croceum (strain F 1598) TaxID=765440 RepID=A0A0C3BZW8_PILCF|nr:hypothetical protein PILCRDRAFT_445107 [Piloderma croceum F 1598]
MDGIPEVVAGQRLRVMTNKESGILKVASAYPPTPCGKTRGCYSTDLIKKNRIADSASLWGCDAETHCVWR